MSLQIPSSNEILVNKILIGLVLGALALANFGQVRAQEEKQEELRQVVRVQEENQEGKAKELIVGEIFGAKEFRLQCATCHGSEGKGNGPIAQSLKSPPPDLTTLTKRHDGRFPIDYVIMVIDGREMMSTHGTREMPIWGERYSEEFAGTGISGFLVRTRIFELIYFLLKIQSPVSEP